MGETLGEAIARIEREFIRLGAVKELAELDQHRANWRNRRDEILAENDE